MTAPDAMAVHLQRSLRLIEEAYPGFGVFLAARVKMGALRLTGEPLERPETWQVDVYAFDDWLKVVRVPWRRLGGDLEQVRAELADDEAVSRG